jgi:hypothetical protein
MGMDLKFPFINWVDITPRLGITNLDFRLDPKSIDGLPADSAASFTQRRSPTTALELGLESRGGSFLLRGWGAGSFSIGVVKLDKNFTTTSYRFGLDLYKDIAQFGNTRLAGLGFFVNDLTSIRSNKTETLESEQSATERLDMVSTYLGAGVTLSW